MYHHHHHHNCYPPETCYSSTQVHQSLCYKAHLLHQQHFRTYGEKKKKRTAPHESTSNTLRMILDSGCSQHITNISRSILYDIRKVTAQIDTAGNHTLTSEASGDFSLLLNNILHCPDATYNLCSVGQLCEQNKTIVFTSSTATIYSSDDFFCSGINIVQGTKRSSGLYTIDLTSDHETNNNSLQSLALAANAVITKKCTRWHHVLNHINNGAN